MYGHGCYGAVEYGGGRQDLGSPGDYYRDSISLIIGGAHHAQYLADRSLSVSMRFSTNATASFKLHDTANGLTIVPGESVRISMGGHLVFGGTIDRVKEEFPSLDTSCPYKVIDIRCTGWEQVLSRRLVADIYEDMTAGAIVRDIIDRYFSLEGFSTDEVEDGPTLDRVRFEYKSASKCISEVAKLAGYTWRSGPLRNIIFSARTTYDAPFTISSTTRNFASLQKQVTRKDYRNVQFIRGGQSIAVARTRDFLTDGEATSWTLEWPVAAEPTITLGGTGQTVGIRTTDADDDPDGPAFYWSAGEKTISYNRELDAPASGQTLSITYQPFLPILAMIADVEAIEERQSVESGSGYYESMANEPLAESSELARTFGEAYLTEHARINTELNLDTYTGGLEPGQILTVDLGSAVEGIDDEFLISAVTVKEVGAGKCIWRVQGYNNSYVGGWEEFFANFLEKQKAVSTSVSDKNLLKYGYAASKAVITDAGDYETGVGLSDWEDDEYTVAVVGTAQCGHRWTDLGSGVTYNRGAIVGEVRSP